MSQNHIGKCLRSLREKCGYTQQQLANVLNIDRSTYSYYESGKTSPDISSLITLANVFSISLEELLGQETPSPILNDSGSKARPQKKITDNNSHIYDLRKEELQLIAFFRATTPEKRAKILEDIKGGIQNANNENDS